MFVSYIRIQDVQGILDILSGSIGPVNDRVCSISDLPANGPARRIIVKTDELDDLPFLIDTRPDGNRLVTGSRARGADNLQQARGIFHFNTS
jgi:hypothetical protein